MSRSSKKGPWVEERLMARIEALNAENNKKMLRTWSRASTIFPEMVGHTIAVHDGTQTRARVHQRVDGRPQARRVRAHAGLPRPRRLREGPMSAEEETTGPAPKDAAGEAEGKPAAKKARAEKTGRESQSRRESRRRRRNRLPKKARKKPARGRRRPRTRRSRRRPKSRRRRKPAAKGPPRKSRSGQRAGGRQSAAKAPSEAARGPRGAELARSRLRGAGSCAPTHATCAPPRARRGWCAGTCAASPCRRHALSSPSPLVRWRATGASCSSRRWPTPRATTSCSRTI